MLKLLEKVNATKKVPWDYDIYDIIVDHQLVGRIVYRYGTDEQLKYSGHVGYTIEPEYRGHGYAYQALNELFDLIDKKEIIISCDLDNIASYKTIEKCHVLSKERIVGINDPEFKDGIWRFIVKKR